MMIYWHGGFESMIPLLDLATHLITGVKESLSVESCEYMHFLDSLRDIRWRFMRCFIGGRLP